MKSHAPVGYIRMYKAEWDAKLCPVSTSVNTLLIEHRENAVP